jgi:hypothetical protein
MLWMLIGGRLKRQCNGCVHMMGSVPRAGFGQRFRALPLAISVTPPAITRHCPSFTLTCDPLKDILKSKSSTRFALQEEYHRGQ